MRKSILKSAIFTVKTTYIWWANLYLYICLLCTKYISYTSKFLYDMFICNKESTIPYTARNLLLFLSFEFHIGRLITIFSAGFFIFLSVSTDQLLHLSVGFLSSNYLMIEFPNAQMYNLNHISIYPVIWIMSYRGSFLVHF